MNKSALLGFAFTCWLSTTARAQNTLETARRQTASALRAVLPQKFDADDVRTLAALGDSEGARSVALRQKDREERLSSLALVTRYSAKQALRTGQLASAEKEI